MIFRDTEMAGVVLVDPEPHEDERGFFARTWSAEEFAARGLNPRIAECSMSYSARVGTLRGMHYQDPPYREAKLVRCTSGAIYDVVVDLRPGSGTFRRWLGFELSARAGSTLYVPEGVAHGFLTLKDETEVFYQISEPYRAELQRGLRWDDPAIGIEWPVQPSIVSARDRSFALIDAS